jgi:hypothetical protein
MNGAKSEAAFNNGELEKPSGVSGSTVGIDPPGSGVHDGLMFDAVVERDVCVVRNKVVCEMTPRVDAAETTKPNRPRLHNRA